MKRSLFALFALFAASCSQPSCVTTPAPKPPPVDAGTCERAQSNLDALHCPLARSAGGITYAATCVDLADAGIGLRAACVASAKSCEEADKCSR